MCSSIFFSFFKKSICFVGVWKGSGLSQISIFFWFICLLGSRMKWEQSLFMLRNVLIHTRWWWWGWDPQDCHYHASKSNKYPTPNTVTLWLSQLHTAFHHRSSIDVLFRAKVGEEASNISYSKAIHLYDNHFSKRPLTAAITPALDSWLFVLFSLK